mmetsp:Transcript_88273/g.285735  ORF Transcript_88273/g.285735 Transcript_88273/m.285735 type:complete len:202 (+) Transcript_88273:596-1201(+)
MQSRRLWGHEALDGRAPLEEALRPLRGRLLPGLPRHGRRRRRRLHGAVREIRRRRCRLRGRAYAPRGRSPAPRRPWCPRRRANAARRAIGSSHGGGGARGNDLRCLDHHGADIGGRQGRRGKPGGLRLHAPPEGFRRCEHSGAVRRAAAPLELPLPARSAASGTAGAAAEGTAPGHGGGLPALLGAGAAGRPAAALHRRAL